jgi:hypothetical protein
MPSISDYENGLYEAMNEDTIEARGTATAPVASATICQVSLPTSGVWEITFFTRLGTGGAPAAADQDNVYLSNSTLSASIMNNTPLIAVSNSVPIPLTIRREFLTPTVVAINAMANATVSVPYYSYIVARKVSDTL